MSEIYAIHEPELLLSPSLVVFRDLVLRNLEAMIVLAGSTDRLRLHVKTHKMPDLVRLLEERGVHKHKCATIAEAEMIAQAGGRDVLLAYPLVGPNIARLAALMDAYPSTIFRTTVDDPDAAQALASSMESSSHAPLSVLIDLDVGMGRTGIAPEQAFSLAKSILKRKALRIDGLHVYDGHIRQKDLAERTGAAQPGIEAALRLRDDIQGLGSEELFLVMGGTPTFPVHSALDVPGVECSPGTCLFHDVGYGTQFPDLPFTPAALLFTRVVSRPRPDRLCLDLGYKAVAADPPMTSRMRLVELPEAAVVVHSEEHLVVETSRASEYPLGTSVLAIPGHICPTSALHRSAYVIDQGRLAGNWEVKARDRVLRV